MSNRKYPRLADGYHDRSQYHPYQTTGKYSKTHQNCLTERSPNDSGAGSRGNSPYNSSRHSKSSPRSHRPKSSYSRSRESGKRGSSKSPSDSHGHLTNSHGSDRHSKPNHINDSEGFHWSQHNSSSGKVYYYNSKTEKSQWEKPKEWIERERRERERKEREKREMAGIKEGREANKDSNSHPRESSHSKSNNSVSKNASRDGREKRDGSSQHGPRGTLDEQRKEVLPSVNSDGRRNQVVKTCSAHTTALSTAVPRSTPMDATPGGDTYTSPAGSVQDVSPPSTPSSDTSIMKPASHSASPKFISLALSPHLAQMASTAHSPQINYSQPPQQQQQQQPPYVARHGFPQASVSPLPAVQGQQCFIPQQQYNFPQQSMVQHNNYGQYAQMNAGVAPAVQQGVPLVVAPMAVTQTSQQSLPAFDTTGISQPVLHPLQQATLLQQRQLAGAQHQGIANLQSFQPAHAASQSSSPQMPTLGHMNDRAQSTPSSPVVFSHSSTQEQYMAASAGVHASLPSSSSAVPYSSAAASSPVPTPKSLAPSVNLQSLAKYVDKGLTGHITAWPTEALERQLQKLSEETTNSTNECDRLKTGQIQFQSQLGFMELRVETGTRRLAALKELTRTLDTLLAESDAKPLNSWKS